MSDIHIIPNEDLMTHIESIDCPCSPTEKDGVIIHNSADFREDCETEEDREAWHEYCIDLYGDMQRDERS
jgi:hypothetical protein